MKRRSARALHRDPASLCEPALRIGFRALLLAASITTAAPATAAPDDDEPAAASPEDVETRPAELPPHIRIIPDASVGEGDDRPAVDLAVVYTREVWANVSGGIRRGSRSLDNLDATLTVDGGRALGWNGATLFLYGLYNSGTGFSRDLVGDVQGASNIETAVEAVRLYEAWIEQKFAGGRASIKIGLFDLNSEFDVQDTGSLFMGSSHGIGPDFSQSGRNGPSIFPVTSLAARVDYRLSERWLARAAVLDAVPGDPDRPRRTAIDIGGGEGVLTVGEIEHRSGSLRAVAGYWRYTAPFERLLASAIAGRPVEGHGNDGFYVMADRRFTATPEDPRGLAAWVRFGIADPGFNPIGLYLGGGLVYTGPLRSRPADHLGLAFTFARFGSEYRGSLAARGLASEGSERSIELTYRATLTDWLAVQPNLQYIADPGSVPSRRDAVLIGIRTQIGF